MANPRPRRRQPGDRTGWTPLSNADPVSRAAGILLASRSYHRTPHTRGSYATIGPKSTRNYPHPRHRFDGAETPFLPNLSGVIVVVVETAAPGEIVLTILCIEDERRVKIAFDEVFEDMFLSSLLKRTASGSPRGTPPAPFGVQTLILIKYISRVEL